MITINLISAKRRATLVARRRAKAWAKVVCAYCAALAVLGGASLLGAQSAPRHSGEILAVERDVQRMEETINTMRPQMRGLEMQVEVNRTILRQPDWSILMALVAKAADGQVSLYGCGLSPAAANAPPQAPKAAAAIAKCPTPPDKYLLRLSGVGLDQSAVAQFVLRLEQSGLFSTVSLLNSSRQNERVDFQLECCLLQEGGRP